MDGQECVGWTLLAQAGLFLDVVSWWAGDAGRARLLRAQGTRPAGRGDSVHGVGHRDGVDLGHVIEELSGLEREPRKSPRGHHAVALGCCVGVFSLGVFL